jgi:hypothetical protein
MLRHRRFHRRLISSALQGDKQESLNAKDLGNDKWRLAGQSKIATIELPQSISHNHPPGKFISIHS